MWAYQATMIAEARRCGGRGWALYDSAFRQRVSSLQEVDFSKLNQSLYSTTFLAYGGRGRFCASCSMSHHTPEECALHPNRSMPVIQLQGNLGGVRRERAERDSQTPRSRGESGPATDGTTGSVPFNTAVLTTYVAGVSGLIRSRPAGRREH